MTEQKDTAQAVRNCIDDISLRLNDYLDLLAAVVDIDSGEDLPAGILAVEQRIAGALNGEQTRFLWKETDNKISHFKATIPGGPGQVVLLGHADTVFKKGTSKERPFSIQGARAFGPGVIDMKGGLVLALATVNWLIENKLSFPTIELLVVGDEETRTTPPPFIKELEKASACFVLECGRPGGGFVVSRKGGVWATVSCTGFPAHAGTEPDKGKNAILALCREVQRISSLDSLSDDLTVGTGTIAGGTAVNVVPEYAEARIDIRSADDMAIADMIRRIGEFEDHEGISLNLVCDLRWPAMTRGRNESLITLYEKVAEDAGAAVFSVSTGGMSDGNWFANMGIPTLDGLGPIGGLDHGPDEYMEISSFAVRAGLLAGMLMVLESP
ncbi:MAG: M20/M25/M40 family metallo-hydrolase [Deltaproteobacteria bacterium]|nr:M20/M25/M40 family metallo-hydrolase [Deltaproteobacteria bacterium]